MGPVPKPNSTTAAMRVVTLASRMVEKAFWYPDWMLACGVFRLRSSSRIRSKMRTFASTAMPTVSTMPAIPGRVRVAWSMDSTATMSTRLAARARFATSPKRRYQNAMNPSTRQNPMITERSPWSMLSWPRLGPTVRSSMISMGAASAPARSSSARSRASAVLSSPVIWKRLPSRSRMTAMLMTSSIVRRLRTSRPSTRRTSVLFSMNTTAMLRPILSFVRSEKSRAPFPSRVMKTAGEPVC